MKKLLTLLCFTLIALASQSQTVQYTTDDDGVSFRISILDSPINRMCLIVKGQEVLQSYADTFILGNDTLFLGDLDKFREAYSWGDHSGQYRAASWVPSWSDVTGKPSFSTVSTSGNYSDLSGLPSIPSAQVNSDWNAVSGVQQILNKPSLFSGSYGDLTGVPSTFTPSSHTHAFNDLTSKPTSLSGYGITDPVVLTSGSYNNPTWLTGLAYSKLSGVPSTFTPASHTHAWTEITGAPSFITGNQSITISGDISGTGTTSISTSISNNTITSAKIVDGSIIASDLNSMSATNGQVLKYNGTAWAPATDATGSAPATDKAAVYSIGTPYNITTTPAKVDFTGASSVDPSVVIPAPGTYVIMSNVRIDYAGLTNVAANTVSVKLRRTNNTATDIASATGDFTVPPVTLLTSTGGDCDISTVFYTTTNSNDIIEIWASRSASISVGNIVAGNAWIVAYRIY